MKNTYGNHVAVTLFGESHGPSVGVVIGGFVGLKIHFGTLKKIDEMLTQIKELKGE